VRCRIQGQSRKTCDAYVIRREGGAATVEFRAGSLVRRVLFVDGKPAAQDSTYSFSYETNDDMTTIRLGDSPEEEYTVAEAFISGG
jgi:hypothetical protein